MTYKIHYESSICHTPPFTFLLDQFVTALKLGNVDPEFVYANVTPVVYAVNTNGEVIGATTWHSDRNRRIAWELFAAVAEDYRGQGVYTAIWNFMVELLKKQGITVLYNTVNVNNAPSMGAMKKQNRSATCYRLKTILK